VNKATKEAVKNAAATAGLTLLVICGVAVMVAVMLLLTVF
jgi:hypothetical protein